MFLSSKDLTWTFSSYEPDSYFHYLEKIYVLFICLLVCHLSPNKDRELIDFGHCFIQCPEHTVGA